MSRGSGTPEAFAGQDLSNGVPQAIISREEGGVGAAFAELLLLLRLPLDGAQELPEAAAPEVGEGEDGEPEEGRREAQHRGGDQRE
jgi:hypothetical protein